jgi:Gpi18-like mannosyltransferase
MILGNSRLAVISTMFFSFWPGALYYSAAYSESLFMSLALGAFYFLEKEQSGKAVSLGFLAGFARSNGFLIFIPFLFYGLQKRRFQLILQSILVASPYLWFNLYGYFSTGVFPVREIAARHYWETPVFLLNQITSINEGYAVLFSAEILLIIFPFCALLLNGLKMRSSSQTFTVESRSLKYWAFSLVTLLMIFFYSGVLSIQRYAIPMLPLYWVSAQTWVKNKKLGIFLFAAFTAILIVGTVLFATWWLYC